MIHQEGCCAWRETSWHKAHSVVFLSDRALRGVLMRSALPVRWTSFRFANARSHFSCTTRISPHYSTSVRRILSPRTANGRLWSNFLGSCKKSSSVAKDETSTFLILNPCFKVAMTQIAEQSPNKLVLRQNYVSFGRVFREILVTGIGVGFLVWSGPAKLNCQRIEPTQVMCQLSKPGWLGLGVWRSIQNFLQSRCNSTHHK